MSNTAGEATPPEPETPVPPSPATVLSWLQQMQFKRHTGLDAVLPTFRVDRQARLTDRNA